MKNQDKIYKIVETFKEELISELWTEFAWDEKLVKLYPHIYSNVQLKDILEKIKNKII